MPRKILMMTANPTDTARLFLEKEIVAIKEGLDAASRSKQFEFIVKTKITMTDLRRAMLNESPQIVHFSGHGAGEQGILLEGDSGKTQLVSSDALAGLFELFAETLECVVLNACYSATQADAIARHIPYVIGMSGVISDGAACEFAVAFYDALGAGKDIPFAHKIACNAIQMAGIKEQHLLPVLLMKSNATAQSPRPAAAPSEAIKANIRELLMSIDSLNTQKGRSALIQSARFDPMLIAQLDADQPLVTFVPNTVATLAHYGILNDGRHALEAVLTAACVLEGQTFQQQCRAVFLEWLGRAPEIVNAAPPQPVTPPRPSFAEIKRQQIEEQREDALKKYEAVSAQMRTTLNESDKIPLQRQREQIEKQIQELEQQLARLQ